MCLSPITLTIGNSSRFKRKITVPCGKCEECKRSRAFSLQKRSEFTARRYYSMYFMTLTFSPKHVPKISWPDMYDEDTGEFWKARTLMTLDNSCISAWKRRCWLRINRSPFPFVKNPSYMIVGEYGCQKHRPHYHCIFFGLTEWQKSILVQDWRHHFGYVDCQHIEFCSNGKDHVTAVSRYIAKYCSKSGDLEDKYVREGWVVKPRVITSVGYGQPSPEDFNRMYDFYTCQDYIPNDPNNLSLLPLSQVNKLVREVVSRVYDTKQYPSKFYVKKLFYYECNNKFKKCQLFSLVSSFVQKRYEDKNNERIASLVQSFVGYTLSQAYRKAAEALALEDEQAAQARFEALYADSKRFFAKSRF